jgi:hypothetical protein
MGFHFGGPVINKAVGDVAGTLDGPGTNGQFRGIFQDASPLLTLGLVRAAKGAVNGVREAFDGLSRQDVVNYFTSKTVIKPLEGPLFGPGGPKATDGGQGQSGDCWLIGNLVARVRQNPESIADMVRENLDGTFTVTWRKACRTCDAWETTVNRNVPFYRQTNMPVNARGTNGIWMPIIEKAAAKEFGGGKGYEGLEGDFTGENAANLEVANRLTLSSGFAVGQGYLAPDGFSALKDAVNRGDSMVVSTPTDNWFELSKAGRGLYESHRYAITGLSEEEGAPTITLFNPHNRAGADILGRYGSEFTMPYETFAKAFDPDAGAELLITPNLRCRSCEPTTPKASELETAPLWED